MPEMHADTSLFRIADTMTEPNSVSLIQKFTYKADTLVVHLKISHETEASRGIKILATVHSTLLNIHKQQTSFHVFCSGVQGLINMCDLERCMD